MLLSYRTLRYLLHDRMFDSTAELPPNFTVS
jgi:hypothetical protein